MDAPRNSFLRAICYISGMMLTSFSPEKTRRPPALPVPRRAPLTDAPVNVDQNRAETIQVRYQSEWRLWAELTEHFGDPDFHAAYVGKTAAIGRSDLAVERYSKWLSIMSVSGVSTPHQRMALHWRNCASTMQILQLERSPRAREAALSAVFPRTWKLGLFLVGFWAILALYVGSL